MKFVVTWISVAFILKLILSFVKADPPSFVASFF